MPLLIDPVIKSNAYFGNVLALFCIIRVYRKKNLSGPKVNRMPSVSLDNKLIGYWMAMILVP